MTIRQRVKKVCKAIGIVLEECQYTMERDISHYSDVDVSIYSRKNFK